MTERRDLRVLHVIPGVAPRYGGPSMVIGPMIATLNGIPGVRAEVATTDADGPGCRTEVADLPFEADTVHLFRRSWSERWKYSGELARWLKRHVADYDLLHIHSLWSFSTVAAARAAIKAGVPYVLRPAGMLSDYSWNRRGWSKRLYWKIAERSTVMSAAGFHVTSEDEANDVRMAMAEARTFLIPNGIENAAWTTPINQDFLRTRCGERVGDRPILLFLSRLHPVKGIVDLLLPAMTQMKQDVFLAIAGGVDPHSPGHDIEVQAAIKQHGLADRVAILGPIAASDRWAHFDGADLFVLPSWSENFGVVVAEAMARSRAVVVTDRVHSRTLIAAAEAGRVVAPNSAALAAALDELRADSALRARMGHRGRTCVKTELGWPSLGEAIVEMYRTCLSNTRKDSSQAISQLSST